MKVFRIGLILFILPFYIYAKPFIFYKKGDQLYVLSKNGLNLRAKPSANGRYLQSISFASTAMVREITNKEFEVEGVKGYWVKVIADDREGYLFDGFLSSYPPPNSILTLKQYARKFLPKSSKISEVTDESLTVSSSLVLPFARIEEAYLLGVCFLADPEKYKFPIKQEKIKYPNSEIEFQIEKDKEGQIKLLSAKEIYSESSGSVSLIIKDLGNYGVEIQTVFSPP